MCDLRVATQYGKGDGEGQGKILKGNKFAILATEAKSRTVIGVDDVRMHSEQAGRKGHADHSDEG